MTWSDVQVVIRLRHRTDRAVKVLLQRLAERAANEEVLT
jgi:hypothetical protein